MKKVLFFLSIMLSVAIFSCSESDDGSMASKGEAHSMAEATDAWQALLASIEALNDKTFGDMPQTRTIYPYLNDLDYVLTRLRGCILQLSSG